MKSDTDGDQVSGKHHGVRIAESALPKRFFDLAVEIGIESTRGSLGGNGFRFENLPA